MFISSFLAFSHEFSQIIDHGEYGKVHIDLVFPFMTKTSVMPVGFDLSENNLRFYRSSVSATQPFLRGEHLPCLSFLIVEAVIRLYRSFALFLSTDFFLTKVYLLVSLSIFVTSMYCSSRGICPISTRGTTTRENSLMNGEETQDNGLNQSVVTFIYRSGGCIPICRHRKPPSAACADDTKDIRRTYAFQANR